MFKAFTIVAGLVILGVGLTNEKERAIAIPLGAIVTLAGVNYTETHRSNTFTQVSTNDHS